MPASFFYSSTAVPNSIVSTIGGAATAATLASTPVGYPSSYPFKAVLSPDTGSEEIVYVTDITGVTVTMERAKEGTSAQTHESGAAFAHRATGKDLQDSRDHEAATTSAHGIADISALATKAGVETLTNKSIDGASNTLTGIDVSDSINVGTNWAAVLEAALGANWASILGAAIGAGWGTALGSALGSGWTTELAAAISGALVDTTATQTLTNKTINANSNDLLNIPVDFDEASDAANEPIDTSWDSMNPNLYTYTPPAGWNTYKIMAVGFISAVPASSGVQIETRMNIDGLLTNGPVDNPNTTDSRFLMAAGSATARSGTIAVRIQARTVSSTATSISGHIIVIAARET